MILLVYAVNKESRCLPVRSASFISCHSNLSSLGNGKSVATLMHTGKQCLLERLCCCRGRAAAGACMEVPKGCQIVILCRHWIAVGRCKEVLI